MNDSNNKVGSEHVQIGSGLNAMNPFNLANILSQNPENKLRRMFYPDPLSQTMLYSHAEYDAYNGSGCTTEADEVNDGSPLRRSKNTKPCQTTRPAHSSDCDFSTLHRGLCENSVVSHTPTRQRPRRRLQNQYGPGMGVSPQSTESGNVAWLKLNTNRSRGNSITTGLRPPKIALTSFEPTSGLQASDRNKNPTRIGPIRYSKPIRRLMGRGLDPLPRPGSDVDATSAMFRDVELADETRRRNILDGHLDQILEIHHLPVQDVKARRSVDVIQHGLEQVQSKRASIEAQQKKRKGFRMEMRRILKTMPLYA